MQLISTENEKSVHPTYIRNFNGAKSLIQQKG